MTKFGKSVDHAYGVTGLGTKNTELMILRLLYPGHLAPRLRFQLRRGTQNLIQHKM